MRGRQLIRELTKRFEDEFARVDSDQDGEISVREAEELFQNLNIPHKNFVRILKLTAHCNDGQRLKISDFMAENAKTYLTRCMQHCLPEYAPVVVDGKEEFQVNMKKMKQVMSEKCARGQGASLLLKYLLFFALYGTIIILQLSPWDSASTRTAMLRYFADQLFTSSLSISPLTFHEIQTVDDLWQWQMNVFVEKFYVDTYYNGQPVSGEDANYLLEHIKKTGTFRLLQRRSRNGACGIPARFPGFAADCYGQTWGKGLHGPVETSPFIGASTGSAYVYSDIRWYASDSGYTQVMPATKDGAIARLQSLKRDAWISAATRYFRLDFSAYSPNTGLFISSKFEAELPTSGGLVTSVEVVCRKLAYLRTSTDYLRLALECIFTFILVVFFARQSLQVYANKEKLRSSLEMQPRTALVLVQLLCLVTCIALWIWIVMKADSISKSLQVSQQEISLQDGETVNFYDLSPTFKAYFALHAVNVLVSMMILLDLLRFNPSMEVYLVALYRELRLILAILALLVLFALIFAVHAMMLFSRSTSGFSNLLASVNTLLSFLHGHRTANELVEISPASLYSIYLPLLFSFFFLLVPSLTAILYYRLSQQRKEGHRTRRTKCQMLDDNLFDQLLEGFKLWLPRRLRSKKNKTEMTQVFLAKTKACQSTTHIMFDALLAKMDNTMSEKELMDLVEQCDAFEHEAKDWNIDPQAAEEKVEQETEELYENMIQKMEALIQDNKLAYQRLSFMEEVMGYRE